MIASCSGLPARSIGTVPDHCEVTATAITSSGCTAPRAITRCDAVTIPFHHSAGDCSAPSFGRSFSSTGVKSPSTYFPASVNSATLGPEVPRSIVSTWPVVSSAAIGSALALHPVTEEAAFRAGVCVVVVGDVPHVVVDVVLEREVLGDDAREVLVHVRQLGCGWVDAVPAPDDHRRRADLALGDPADVVLVVPRRDPRRFAEIAPVRVLVPVSHGA